MVWARPPAGAKLVGSTGYGRSVGGCLASKEVVLKEHGGSVRRVHSSLDPLTVPPLPKEHRVALQRSLSKLLWKGASPLVHRHVLSASSRCGLGMPDLESHWLAERLAYLGRSFTTDAVWSLKVRGVFSRLRSNPEAEVRRRPRDEAPFARECRRAIRNLPRSSDLSRSRKELYQ